MDQAAPPEHIIPECLGCPPEAVFSDGEVCTRCNNMLSRVDNALCDGFDLFRIAFGQRGKKGRLPSLASRPNARTVFQKGEHSLQINFGPGEQLTPSGHRLKAPAKDIQSIVGDIAIDGDVATATYRAHMFFQRDFTRGIYKIAIETIALFLGVEAARDVGLDSLKRQVLDSSSKPPLCLIGLNEYSVGQSGFSHELYSPRITSNSRGYLVPIRLFNIEFTADCTPNQEFIAYMLGLREFSPLVHKWRILPWEFDGPAKG